MTTKNSRQKLEIEYRRQCVKDVWIKLGVFSVTQQQIVNSLKDNFDIEVDQTTISRDLKIVKQRIQEQTADELKSEFFAGYMRIINEAREGWRRSLEDAKTETVEVVEMPETRATDGTLILAAKQRTKASSRTEGQSGNPSFLDQEQKAFKAMRELFGVDLKNEPGSSEDSPFYQKMVILPPKKKEENNEGS